MKGMKRIKDWGNTGIMDKENKWELWIERMRNEGNEVWGKTSNWEIG